MNVLEQHHCQYSCLSNRWIWNTWQVDNSCIHSSMCSGRCYVHREPIKLHRCVFNLIYDRLFSRRNGAWRCWISAAAATAADSLSASLLSPPPPSSPRGQTGMVSSRRTCHCHRGGEGSRSVRAEEGWGEVGETEGFIHCLPLQCGGCCCSGATPGRPFHSFSVRFSTSTPRGPLLLRRWMGFLIYPWVRYLGVCFFAAAAGADWMCVCVSQRVRASDNGASRGNLATSLLANCIYALC